MKQTVITIPSDDQQFCCTRALVTVKAKADQHPKWRSFLRGCTLQTNEAIRLHVAASVLLGPCGPAELRQFMAHASMRDYHLIVVDADRAYSCFKYGTGPTPLALLFWDEHNDAITSLPGFFGRSYFSGTGLKGVNNLEHHYCGDDANLYRKCSQGGFPITR